MSRAEIRQISLMALGILTPRVHCPCRGLPFSLASRGIGFDSMHPLSADLFTKQYAPNPARGRLLRSLFAWIHGNLRPFSLSFFLSFCLIRPIQATFDQSKFKGNPVRNGERGINIRIFKAGMVYGEERGEAIVDAKEISVLTRVQRKLTVTNRRTTPDYDNWKDGGRWGRGKVEKPRKNGADKGTRAASVAATWLHVKIRRRCNNSNNS